MAVLFVMSIVLVVLPKFGEISIINDQRISNDQKTKLNIEKKNYLMSIDQEEMSRNADLLGRSIIQERDSYFLVSILRKVFDTQSYQIQSFFISPGEIKQDDIASDNKAAVKMIPITLTVSGPKDKYVALLSAIEKSLPILSLGKVNMSSVNDTARLELTISAYYLPRNGNINVNNLTLTDLTLKKDEIDLFKKLATFNQLDSSTEDVGSTFVKYDRQDPFKL